MKEMKTLTVGGETYRITDPEAARIDDSQISAGTTWSSQKIAEEISQGGGQIPEMDEIVSAVIDALPIYNGEVAPV